jgi:hypothetical protein
MEKISIPRLTGAINYNTWNIQIQAVLRLRKLIHCLFNEPLEIQESATLDSISTSNTSINTTNSTIPTAEENEQALCLILTLCDSEPIKHIEFCDTAKKAYTTLKNVYRPDGFTTNHILCKQFLQLNLEGCEQMEQYITKAKSLVNALADNDLKLPEEFVLNWVLNSLTTQYDGFVANITQALRVNKNAYNLTTLSTTLLDEARRVESVENSQVMVIKRPKPTFKNRVTKPNQTKAKNAWKKEKGAYCNHCKVATHFTNKCFYLFPENAPKGWDQNKDPNRRSQAYEKREARILNITNGDNTTSKNTSNTTSNSTSSPSEKTTSNKTSSIASGNNTTNSSEDLLDFDQMDIEQPEYSIDLFGDYIVEKAPTQVYITLKNNTTPNTEYITNKTLGISTKKIDNLKIDIQNVQVFNTYSNSNKYKANFIIDTAAESHIISDKRLYYSFKECNRKVSWGNAKTIEIKGIGNIYIEFLDTNIRLLLRNCLYMPELGVNLISQGELNDITTIFTKSNVFLRNKDNKNITQGEKIGNLYFLPIRVISNTIVLVTNKHTSDRNTSILWHERLGHINIKALKALIQATNGSNIDNTINDSIKTLEKCEICLKANLTNTINKNSSNTTIYEYLDKISSDLCGPINPPTYNNYKYFITFLDRKTRYLEVELLKTKDEAYEAFLRFKAKAENQAYSNSSNTTNKRIKILSTDNGTEYINKRFKIALDKAGIIHQTSSTYTPEQNGFIERINRTLLNKVRSLLLNSNLNKKMWGEALLSAVYLYNRTPHSKLGYKTPHEIKNGELPNIGNIKVFGSLVYFKQKGPNNVTKLDKRGNLGILIGYGTNSSHYKIWDLENNKPIWARDLYIMENRFLKPNTNNITTKERTINSEAIVDINTGLNNSTSNNNNNSISISNDNTIENTTTRSTPNISTIYEDEENDVISTISPNRTNNPQPSSSRTAILDASYTNEVDDLILVITNTNKEPTTYNKAIKGSDSEKWLKAMEAEVVELEAQKTWELVDLPNNREALGGRWVYKIKTNAQNEIIKYKARWVVQGFNQILGIDYLETFSTTCRPESYRLVFLLALYNGWAFLQYDVKNAFVHAEIDKEIYVKQPTGFEKGNYVCKLKKALYGLKQSPRLWYKYLKDILYKYGFKVLPYDEGVFINTTNSIIILCHVDDLIVVGPNKAQIESIINQASKDIKIQPMGTPSTFLGIEIVFKPGTLFLHQNKYVQNLLIRFNKANIRPYNIPIEVGIKLKKSDYKATPSEIKLFQQQVGALLYLAIKTRPDIATAINQCSRYMSNPDSTHWKALDRIWGYLNYKPTLGLTYSINSTTTTTKGSILKLLGYSDASWGDDLVERKSSTGYIFLLDGINPISWYTTLQKTIALSTCEAEYMALKDSGKEAIYLYNLLSYIVNELKTGNQVNQPILITDSQSAQSLAENPEFHKRTKHIDIQYHFIRQLVNEKKLIITYTASKTNLADPFTKGVPKDQFYEFLQRIGLKDTTKL